MKRFESKVVLVTGGSSGIGKATAEAFAREGAKVVVSARREKEGVEVVKGIQAAGGTARFIRADVANDAEVKALLDQTVTAYGGLDVLFNNAGIEGRNGPIGTFEAKDIDETFGVNVRGLLLATKYALPHLIKSKGNIVNNGSVVAEIGFPNAAIYSATKGAVHALTRSTAIEFIGQGVRVNAVAPGPIVTDMATRLFGPEETMREYFKGRIPTDAPGDVEDIAQAVLYLAAPEARFVVGQVLLVDGGRSIQ